MQKKDQLARYLETSVGVEAEVRPWPADQLPTFIASRYQLASVRVDGSRYLGVFVRDVDSFEPQGLHKQLSRIPDFDEQPYVLVLDRMPAGLRKRLVADRIPFVVPGSQMYWPSLGLEIRNRSTSHRPAEPRETLDPAAQAIFIGILTGKVRSGAASRAVVDRFPYTAMTVTRCLNQLEHVGLVTTYRSGRERRLEVDGRPAELWDRGRGHVRSPVQSVETVDRHEAPVGGWTLAGETALSRKSMLVEPAVPTYAVHNKTWNRICGRLPDRPVHSSRQCRVEVWRYDPVPLAEDGIADSYSLWLSLSNAEDERVQMALSEMMETTGDKGFG